VVFVGLQPPPKHTPHHLLFLSHSQNLSKNLFYFMTYQGMSRVPDQGV
jgi:phosphatidylethanolamine-binding protein (PEBP) family uncharacterized protein